MVGIFVFDFVRSGVEGLARKVRVRGDCHRQGSVPWNRALPRNRRPLAELSAIALSEHEDHPAPGIHDRLVARRFFFSHCAPWSILPWRRCETDQRWRHGQTPAGGSGIFHSVDGRRCLYRRSPRRQDREYRVESGRLDTAGSSMS